MNFYKKKETESRYFLVCLFVCFVLFYVLFVFKYKGQVGTQELDTFVILKFCMVLLDHPHTPTHSQDIPHIQS